MQWDKEIYNNLIICYTPARGLITNCVEQAAAISCQHYRILESTPNFRLENYQVDVQKEDGDSKERVDVNEAQILDEILSTGKTDCKAGIMINREKYKIISYDAYFKTAYLSKSNGGACAIKTNQTIVFASWNKDLVTGGVRSFHQNASFCNERCRKFAQSLVAVGL
ncbi:unnamed protein product [Blepharisma stoltei]|uniref:Profilin n=1 Tax=Blepharisma stoltei TaxID=1481888 RepID=A0AAU9JKE8_9CILI|nr:unnamed protein product [Blepharisma stoltei]